MNVHDSYRKKHTEALKRVIALELQLAEAREAIRVHKRRKESWGFEGADYDKNLWVQLKEQG